MSKKGVVIASAVAAAIILAGCSKQEPMPQGSTTQSGSSAKLGKMGGSGCKGHHCKGNHCKGHSCNGKY